MFFAESLISARLKDSPNLREAQGLPEPEKRGEVEPAAWPATSLCSSERCPRAPTLSLDFFGGELGVLLHAVMHVRGHFALADKALACVEAVLIPLDPIGIDCEFI